MAGLATAFTVNGGVDNDVVTGGSLFGGAGNDVLNGDGGNDLLVGVVANLATGVGTDTLIGIETLIGSVYADTLTGDGGNNLIDGGAGTAADTLAGRGGIDTLTYANAAAKVSVNLSNIAAQATGGAGIVIDASLAVPGSPLPPSSSSPQRSFPRPVCGPRAALAQSSSCHLRRSVWSR
ncbi:Ca2+-binding RTX toxin-like protein [Sphingomonas zeicaulis]|uniref:calcium-binding protein n=1 Tax=Sphingomonas zeicaulis TaxID=1632740 RepID=UPI003D1D70FD